MTRHLSMSMFASKEDLLQAKLSQLEADNAALMEALKPFADLADAISPGRMFTTVHNSLIRDAAEVIARLKQEASK